MKKGLLITLEGVDGSGKTCVSEALCKKLNQVWKGGCIKTREPGGIKIAEQIREIILDVNNANMNPMTEILLYQAGRIEHIENVIKPALAEGKIVVCDRYIDSTVAYQYYGRIDKSGFTEKDLMLINLMNERTGCIPDLTFVLSVSEETVHKRMNAREQAKDRFDLESDDFRKRVRDGYMKIAEEEPDRVKVLSGEIPVNYIVDNIMACIKAKIGEEDFEKEDI